VLLEILINLLTLSVAAGFVGAISGLGGGVFIVPALVIFAHMPMKSRGRRESDLRCRDQRRRQRCVRARRMGPT